MVLKINGDIVGNDWEEIYDWFGIECTTPRKVSDAIATMAKGDRLQVKINSGGGEVSAGQEIYSMLRSRKDVDIEVESMAASAASVIAMAGRSTISPVGMIMIHCVSVGGASGNHSDMEKMAKILKTYDEALANAYVEKTGMGREKIIELMNKETWLTADRAVELGFIDSVSQDSATITNFAGNLSVTQSMVDRFKAEKAKKKAEAELKDELLKDMDLYGI